MTSSLINIIIVSCCYCRKRFTDQLVNSIINYPKCCWLCGNITKQKTIQDIHDYCFGEAIIQTVHSLNKIIHVDRWACWISLLLPAKKPKHLNSKNKHILKKKVTVLKTQRIILVKIQMLLFFSINRAFNKIFTSRLYCVLSDSFVIALITQILHIYVFFCV